MDFAAFRDELFEIMVKKAGLTEKAVELAVKKPLAAGVALLAAGAGAHNVGSTAFKDWKTGRSYRKQMERSRR
jgi:hypothetical protein